jgi:AsmA protein
MAMPKILKYLLIGIAALLALLVAAAGIVAATFNPNDYKPLAIRLLQEKKQRTLTIPSDIKLRFFPKLGAELGQVSISERNSSEEFLAAEHANVSLALIPLLSRQLVVDRVRIDGLRANIRRSRDGRANVDDLVTPQEKEEKSGEQISFDIDSIVIRNAHLVYDDRQQARRIEIASLDLETGKIANGVPSTFRLAADVKGNEPAIDAHVAAQSGFTLDLATKRYVLKGIDAELKGALAGFTGLQLKFAGDADLMPEAKRFSLAGLKLSASGKQAQQTLTARLELPKLAVTDTQVSGGKLAGDAKLTEGGRDVTANFSVPAFEGSPQAFKLPALTLDVAIKDDKLPGQAKMSGALTVKASGNASVHLGTKNVSAALNGTFDQSAFTAKLDLAGFSPPLYTFDIGVDRIDLDRYKATPDGKPATASAPAPEKPMDFSALQTLRADGSVRVGALKVANIHASNVRFHLRAANGKLALDPLAANLYGGSVAGSLGIVDGKPARFTAKQNLTGIQIGPLLKDAIGKAPVEGRGNVQINVAASGATVAQIKKGLNGNASMSLRDGAVRGVNLAQAVRSAKSKIDLIRGGAGNASAQTGAGSAGEKTDFSEMSASFRIAGGVAHNEDLNIKSPLIRVAGSGDIDLGEDRLDYLARTTVVTTLAGQGGPELQSLKGLTVPVRLSGPFNAIGWQVDVAGMASELAKQKLEERKGALTGKAQKSLEEQKTKAQQQLGEQLKGLLGK